MAAANRPGRGAPRSGTTGSAARSLGDVLSNATFRRLWLAGGLISAMRWLDLLVLGVFIYDLTGSPGSVALYFFVRMIPRVLFGIVIGTIADRISRQTMLVAGFLALAAVATGLGALVLTERIEYWHLLVGGFVAGIFWSSEFPGAARDDRRRRGARTHRARHRARHRDQRLHAHARPGPRRRATRGDRRPGGLLPGGGGVPWRGGRRRLAALPAADEREAPLLAAARRRQTPPATSARASC